MQSKRLFAALLAGASLVTLGVAQAQTPTPRPITVGQSISSDLSARDLKAEDNSFYEEYALRLTAGQGVVITLNSSAFDAFVQIGRGRGADYEVLNADDDGGGETNARLRFRADEAGTYIVRANTLNEGETGAYTIAVEARPPAVAPKTAALSLGASPRTVNGVLADGGARAEEEGDQLFDYYTLTLAKDQVVKLDMTSEFDNRLQIGRLNDGVFEAIAMDDDGGGDGNAMLIHRAEEGGSFVVRAEAFDNNGAGAYTLTASTLPAPPARLPRPTGIRVGQSVNGALAFGDPVAFNYTLFDLYELRGRAGETVTITLETPEGGFDPVLEVGGVIDGQWATIAENDDDTTNENGSLNSKLEYTFKENGVLMLRARALRDGVTGPYTIAVK